MTLHLLKPALRADDIFELAARQKKSLRDFGLKEPVFPVWTSRRPARQDELLNQGSVYWIIKKHICCRQEILDIVENPPSPDQEKPSYYFLCSAELIETRPFPKRPFQGWRYLKPENAPGDIGVFDANQDRPPAEMEKELRELGLL